MLEPPGLGSIASIAKAAKITSPPAPKPNFRDQLMNFVHLRNPARNVGYTNIENFWALLPAEFKFLDEPRRTLLNSA